MARTRKALKKTPTAGGKSKKRKTNQPARDEFLAKLTELAEAPCVEIAAAADRLGMTAEAFKHLLESDAQAGRVWRHGKTDAVIRAGKILWKLADDGNTTAARQIMEGLRQTVTAGDVEAMTMKSVAELVGEKIERLDYWYRAHNMPKNLDGTVSLRLFLGWWKRYLISEHTFDPQRLKLIDLEPFLGVSRQTINEWLKDGLPRNTDKTFNLAAVLDWRIRQIGARPAASAAAVNPLAAKKAERLQIEIDQQRGKLVERSRVEIGLAARAGVIVSILDRRGAELPTLLAGLTAENIKPVLDDFFSAMRQAAATIPDDIAAILPEGKRGKLMELLTELVKETDD
jgi:DNA-binding transcriptional regulator YiaG/phage terminase Nu1 subunit (DNA packaging protein)